MQEVDARRINDGLAQCGEVELFRFMRWCLDELFKRSGRVDGWILQKWIPLDGLYRLIDELVRDSLHADEHLSKLVPVVLHELSLLDVLGGVSLDLTYFGIFF